MAGRWWQEGVVYQIYPRSFADSDGDGVGDLPGITARLGHLVDLGVDAVWLSPFYPSPMADFGYDISDYTDVHPLFGTLADFDRLVGEAHGHGIRVVVDFVPNHTSDRHPWFEASRSGRDNPKRDWYVWRDGAPDGGPPNNWLSAFPRVGRAWTFHEGSGQWYLHSFLPQQPDLNWDNPAVEAAMHDVLRFWLDRGVDGFRIDVAHKIGKDPDLADNPPDVPREPGLAGGRRRDEDWPSGIDRLRGIRRVLEEYEDRMAVGEVYVLDQTRLVTYVNAADGLHLAHNFVFLKQPWSAQAFRTVVDEFEALAAPAAWPAWALNNHDHSRVASRYADGGSGDGRARAAAVLLLTLRGTPFLFQGEELGLPDVPVPPERVVDVDGRDPERAPLPWAPPSQAGPGAGFTTGEPWLPITRAADRLNVATQAADGRSTLAFYRRLLALRRAEPALRRGRYTSVDAGPGVFAFLRDDGSGPLLVVLNFEARNRGLGLEVPGAGRAELLLSTVDGRTPGGRLDPARLELGPDEAVVLRLAS